MQCNVILGRLKKWPEPVQFIRNQTWVDFSWSKCSNLVAGRFYLRYHGASSKPRLQSNFFPDKSCDITGHHGHRETKSSWFTPCRDKRYASGLSVKECQRATHRTSHVKLHHHQFSITSTVIKQLSGCIPALIFDLPLPWRWQFWVWQLAGTRRIFLSESQPGAGAE